jgi:glycolate oxidase FAD binding subunit
VERSVRELGHVAPGEIVTDGAVWERLASAMQPKPVALRASVLPADLAQALHGLPETAIGTATLSHGVAKVGLDADDESLRQRVERLGGAWLLERAPASVKRALDVWGPRPTAFDVMARVKREFDPLGTLSPGRFVGRL